ncbi:acyl-CoA dehydrogenase N-terminal domain-containing protein, partial [Marinobacter sp.]
MAAPVEYRTTPVIGLCPPRLIHSHGSRGTVMPVYKAPLRDMKFLLNEVF